MTDYKIIFAQHSRAGLASMALILLRTFTNLFDDREH